MQQRNDSRKASRPDSEVKAQVEAELSCCPQLDDRAVLVKVQGGVVSLGGRVPDLFQKYGAEDAAQRVPGVLAVDNQLEVRAIADPGRDALIGRAALAAIRRQVPLCAEQIRPLVRHGRVTLEGAVDWIYQREEAEEAVRGVPGVVSVTNSIALAAPHPSPA